MFAQIFRSVSNSLKNTVSTTTVVFSKNCWKTKKFYNLNSNKLKLFHFNQFKQTLISRVIQFLTDLNVCLMTVFSSLKLPKIIFLFCCKKVENSDDEIDAATRPNIRIMTVRRADSVTPQLHLPILQNWTSATPGNL